VKTNFLIAYFLLFVHVGNAQINVVVSDVANFWTAFDSLQTTTDRTKQIALVQKLYLDKASFGLNYVLDFQKSKAEDWVDMIGKDKDKLLKIRESTLAVISQKAVIDEKLIRFRQLYPDFKSGDIAFVIGTGIFGGRVSGRNVIVGCEVMANDKPDWPLSIVLHEFVHTQQTMFQNALLTHTIMEGAADFMAELVDEKKLTDTYPGGHVEFGLRNEAAVWKEFKKFMGSSKPWKFYHWLYGTTGVSINGKTMKDLGYFVGYAICKSYYDRATDKQQAVKEIIEFDASSNESARNFLLKSGYVPQRDLAFVKNLVFEPHDAHVKKVLYGYKLTNERIIMRFELPKTTDLANVKQVTVAGSFNDWNPNDQRYKMTLKTGRWFELIVPKTAFKTGQAYSFRFVINGVDWQDAPDEALNVEGNGTENLVLTLK
jgi:hypothetical protein